MSRVFAALDNVEAELSKAKAQGITMGELGQVAVHLSLLITSIGCDIKAVVKL